MDAVILCSVRYRHLCTVVYRHRNVTDSQVESRADVKVKGWYRRYNPLLDGQFTLSVPSSKSLS